MVEHLALVPLVGKGDVVHVNAALHRRQLLSVRLILQIRLQPHQLHEPPQTGDAVDEHLREVGELAHGVDEGAGVEAEGDEVLVVHLPVHDEPPAHGDHRHGQDAHEELHGAHKPGHGLVPLLLGGLEPLVGPVELLALRPLVGEGLGGAHAGDAGLDVRVDARHVLLDPAGGLDHVPAVEVDHDEERGHQQHHHQGQPPLDGEHDGDGPHQGDPGDEQVLGPVVGQLRDVKELCGHPAHQVAGAVLVVEAKREGLQMGEEVLTDVRLHQHTEDMAPVAHHVLEQRPQQIGPHHHRDDREEGPVAALGDELVHAHSGHVGEAQIHQGYGQGADHIQGEKA